MPKHSLPDDRLLAADHVTLKHDHVYNNIPDKPDNREYSLERHHICEQCGVVFCEPELQRIRAAPGKLQVLVVVDNFCIVHADIKHSTEHGPHL